VVVLTNLYSNSIYWQIISWTTIVVHNRDWQEIFQQNSLIERTPKAAFQALDLSIKRSWPFLSDLKIDQEEL